MSTLNLGLKHAMAIGAIWMTGLRLAERLLGLISTVILARLLTPEDFGLVAIAMSLFALIEVFSRLGLETVLIQKESPSKDHYNTAWTLNFLLGLVAAVFLVAISGEVAEFYDSDEVQNVMWAISLLFIVNGFKNIGVVDFQKHLAFHKEFQLYLVPRFFSFFITIVLALIYLNYWALVIGSIIWKILEVIFSYYMHPFRPAFRLNKIHELFGFSKWLVVNNFLMFLLMHSPGLILGKVISLQAAAIFNLASEIGSMATLEIVSNLNRAIFPGYSKVSNETEKLQILYRETIQIIAIIATPLGVGVALISPYLVPLMLGEKWLDVIEPLVYLSLGGSVYALISNHSYIYLALAKPKINTVIMILRSALFGVLLFFLINLNGTAGVAQAYFVTSIVSLLISNLVITSILKIGFFQQLNFYTRPIIAAFVMSTIVFSLTHFTDFNNLITITICILSGAISYTFSIYILWLLSGKVGPEKMVVDFILAKIRSN